MPTAASENLHTNNIAENAPIYVSYFNPFYVFRHPQYVPVQAGKATATHNLHITGDDSADNISALNYLYSELTVLYWVWKNAPKTKYVGFCHYRRFFDVSNKEKYPLAFRAFSEDDQPAYALIPAIDFDTILSDCDLVMPLNVVMTHSLRRNYERNHFVEHYLALEKTIREDFPEYWASFKVILEKSNRLPPYNMFLTRWEIFDQYCTFLFGVLQKLQPQIKLPEDKTQHRIFGYLSERLLAVFIHHQQLKAKECPLFVFNRNAKKKSKAVYHIGNFIKNLNFKQKYLWRGPR